MCVGKDLGGDDRGIIEGNILAFRWKTLKTSGRLTKYPYEIRTEYLLNAHLEFYRYTNLLDLSCLGFLTLSLLVFV
jgi:hypothetical protein